MSKGNYDDIINLKRPESLKHPKMPIENRAAQFSPFAALSGFDDEIDKMTDITRANITESEKRDVFEEAP